MNALALAVALTTLWATVPNRPAAPNRCDNLLISCDSVTAECDTIVLDWPESVAAIEVWWGPRWGTYRLLYEDLVAGREGQRIPFYVPDDTVATVYLVARDSTGNRSCPGNHVTVNAPLSVPPLPGRRGPPQLRFYDVSGRRLDRPRASGIYFERRVWADSASVKRIVIRR